MKKIWMGCLLFFSLCAAGIAADKVEAPDDCKHCGMDRTMFSQSRMLVTYTDGSSVGTCSINCVATEMKSVPGAQVQSIQVADYDSRALTDARSATWVIGGDKQGVMTSVAKWAFANRQGALDFIKGHGGKVATYEEALKITENEQAELDQPQGSHEHMGHGGHQM
ncbi:nosL protein [Geobacter sp. OR-1]|uniref:nitrous oxide reductase accessory protein NosL n=1 Tax=Geobacter sp. OR-1 TaxID=1266765 RepID=UPI00054443B4|nr:nitrous oxide reductase accessory protein NosL [Geobacter sp. OR-1]GAM09847.1 nosL protein [Geobacter sp. OR-1]